MKLRIAFISLFFLLANILIAQNESFSNLVFEGAGMRGLAYAGAVQELEDRNIIGKVEKVAGTSAGAITALLVSLGYSAEELESIISNTDFEKFNDGEYIFVGGISRTNKNFGWYKGDEFIDWLEKLIYTKTENSDITFSELYEQGFKDLYVTATCINQQKLVFLSRLSYPHMKVKDAVRISMSIPLYFEAAFVDEHGSVFKEQNDAYSLDIMVDGGIIGNYPIHVFDTFSIDSLGRSTRIPNPNTIGFRMDSEEQIGMDNSSKNLANIKVEGFEDYISALYILVIESLNRAHLEEYDWKRTISISSMGIGPKVRAFSDDEKKSLILSGQRSTAKFLDTIN